MAVEIDPLTGKPKVGTINFPYPQPGQNLPLVPAAIQQPMTPTGSMQGAGTVFNPNLSQQVIQQAQTKALQGTPSTTAGMVSQQAQNLLQQPGMGRDPAAEQKLALDQLARRQGSDFEAMRQATGGTANLGFNVGELMSAQLQQRQEKTDLSRQMEIDAQNKKQQDMLSALAAGKDAVGMEQSLQTGDIGNLINAAGGALGFAELASKQDILLSEQDFTATQTSLDQEYKLALQANDLNAQKTILSKQLEFEANQARLGYEFTGAQNDLNRLLQTNLANLDVNTQKEMVNLKALVDKDQLMLEQDFASSETELNRQFQEAMQNGDYAQANSMAMMLNEFDAIKQQKDQEWKTAENTAQNAFSSQMQLTQNDFDKGMEYLKYEQADALANEDVKRQEILMNKQSELELQKLTQNFGHNEKLAILDSELQSAKADGDVTRQEALMSFTYDLETQKIEQAQGFEESMAYLDNQLQQALKNKDLQNANILSKKQYEHEMKMQLEPMKLENAKINLEQQGLDMAKIEMEYNKIQDLIEIKQLDPKTALNYISKQFADSLPKGFEFTEASPYATLQALEDDYLNQQFQYALVQGKDELGNLIAGKYDADGKFIGLNDDNLEGLNMYLKSNTYQQEGTPVQAKIIALKSGETSYNTITSSDDPLYQYLLNDVTVPKVVGNNISKGEVGRGNDSRTTYTLFEGVKFINMDGKIWAIDSTGVQTRGGDNWTDYNITEILSGYKTQFTAKE